MVIELIRLASLAANCEHIGGVIVSPIDDLVFDCSVVIVRPVPRIAVAVKGATLVAISMINVGSDVHRHQ